MKIAIIQSNFLPWKGYFDIINDVDLFIFEDDLQYTERDWRNRNRIKTAAGPKWITVPVKGGRSQTIDHVEIVNDRSWIRKHLETIKRSYGKSPFFPDIFPEVQAILSSGERYLSKLNQQFIILFSRYLGCTTRFINSRDLDPQGVKDDRLIDICIKSGANHYLSGPAAKSYIIENKFKQAGIHLEWKSYAGYPEYHQPYPPFEHAVSIIDLLFNYGKNAAFYIWGWRQQANTNLPHTPLRKTNLLHPVGVDAGLNLSSVNP